MKHLNYSMPIKIFISHSSDDKDLVHQVVEKLGKNGILVDEYVFETGERTEQEIDIAIKSSGVFCLLISQSSMNKDWVKKEIVKVKSIIDGGGNIKFLPLIIDEAINHSYKLIPQWIRDEYNLRERFSHPTFLARKIEEELNKLRWEQFPHVKERETIFAGRDYDMAKLRELFAYSDMLRRRAVVVSGIPDGIGRRRLLMEFIKVVNPNKKETHSPLSIGISKDKSIEDFILSLNSLLLCEGNENIVQFISTATREEKIDKAINMISIICSQKEELLIRDDGAIVLNDGCICDWFDEIISSTKINQLVFYIASRNRIMYTHEYPEIVHYALKPFAEKDAMVLLKEALQQSNTTISPEDAKRFIVKTAYLPQLILNCADKIAELGVDLAIKNQREYEYKGDELIKSLVDEFKDNTAYIQMLILLSEVEYLTYRQIESICQGIIDNPIDILMDFFTLSIYEHFGSNNEFIRMNPIISDLVKRSRYRLNPEIWNRLQEHTNEIIEQQDFDSADLGILSKKIENEIKGDIRNINRNHMVPSIALKIIADEYGKKQKHAYNNVVLLCNNILNNSHNLYNDILKRIYYYLCASYAHLGDEAFFELRDKLSEYEKIFLHGIYYRKLKRYDKAEAKFREALNIYPNSYTAKNELAIALQRQGRYPDALHIAKEAYNAQPNNAFYIVTYFKSLVRDFKTEEYVLKELIDKLRSAWDTNKEIFSLMLEAEYEYYRNNDFNAAMTLFKHALEINNFQPIFISASEICGMENRLDVYEELTKKYHYKD